MLGLRRSSLHFPSQMANNSFINLSMMVSWWKTLNNGPWTTLCKIKKFISTVVASRLIISVKITLTAIHRGEYSTHRVKHMLCKDSPSCTYPTTLWLKRWACCGLAAVAGVSIVSEHIQHDETMVVYTDPQVLQVSTIWCPMNAVHSSAAFLYDMM